MSLARSFSIYTVSSVLSAAVPVLLLPVLTRYLSESDYGTAATLQTLIVLFTPPLLFGVHAAIAVEYNRLDSAKFRIFLSTVLRIPLFAFVVLMAVGLLAGLTLPDHLGVPGIWIAACPVFALLTLYPLVLSTVLRMQEKAMWFAYVELASAIISVCLSVLLVVGLHLQWEGRMYAIAATGLVMSIASIVWLGRMKLLASGYDKRVLKETLKFGAGVVPHDLGNNIVRMADRLILVAMLGLASAGQYAVASQIASAMLILLAAFNRAWMPHLVSRLSSDSPEARMGIVRQSYAVMAAFLLFFLAFNFVTPLLYKLLIADKFHESMSYVFWLTLGYLFLAVYLTYVDYIFLTKKTHILSMVTMLNMGTNITLNYLLIKQFGTVGAAMAFACTMFLVMILTFFISNRIHPMPWFFWLSRRRT